MWEERLFGLLHPTTIAIVESLVRIEEPLSARLLVEVLDHRHDLKDLAYHVRKLANAGVLREVAWKQRRGAREHLYRLVI